MDLRRTQTVREVLSGSLLAILRAPALHFAVAGALVFAVSSATGDGQGSAVSEVSREITINVARIRGLQRDYRLANGKLASEAETRALVEHLVHEEILYREALARGFEQGDRSIMWRLAQKMQFLGEDNGEDHATLYGRAIEMGLHRSDPIVRSILVEKIRLVIGRAGARPTDAQLAAWYEEHRNKYAQAGRVSLRQVFFDRDRRGDEGARESAKAAALLAREHGVEVEKALGGDPFVMGSRLPAQGRGDLLKFFGPVFAEEVLALPAGRWSEPVESTYGWHLVWIEERIDARVPELAEVRSRVEKSYESSQRDQRVETFLADTRKKYSIRIEEDAIREDTRG